MAQPATTSRAVRRDEADLSPLGNGSSSRCTSPTGESPVPVSAGAPGSRSAVRVEIPAAEAGRQEPLRREQQRGPQHQVKPAASTDAQRESQAAHVTVKATSRTPRSGGTRARFLLGRGAARVEGQVRNTRGPSARSSWRQGGSYGQKVKSSSAERARRDALPTNCPCARVGDASARRRRESCRWLQ